MRGWNVVMSGSSTNDTCSRIVTASGDGVTLPTDPENRPPPNPPPPPPPPAAPIGAGPWVGPPPPPPPPPVCSLTKVNVMSTSVFFGKLRVFGR